MIIIIKQRKYVQSDQAAAVHVPWFGIEPTTKHALLETAQQMNYSLLANCWGHNRYGHMQLMRDPEWFTTVVCFSV